MNKDKPIKMCFLYSAKGIFNSIIIQHVFSPFVSGRITIEMFRKSRLYVCTFIQLLKTLFPWIWMFIFFWINLVEFTRFRMHHRPGIFKYFHI